MIKIANACVRSISKLLVSDAGGLHCRAICRYSVFGSGRSDVWHRGPICVSAQLGIQCGVVSLCAATILYERLVVRPVRP